MSTTTATATATDDDDNDTGGGRSNKKRGGNGPSFAGKQARRQEKLRQKLQEKEELTEALMLGRSLCRRHHQGIWTLELLHRCTAGQGEHRGIQASERVAPAVGQTALDTAVAEKAHDGMHQL